MFRISKNFCSDYQDQDVSEPSVRSKDGRASDHVLSHPQSSFNANKERSKARPPSIVAAAPSKRPEERSKTEPLAQKQKAADPVSNCLV
jgi:hypothetical protein